MGGAMIYTSTWPKTVGYKPGEQERKQELHIKSCAQKLSDRKVLDVMHFICSHTIVFCVLNAFR